MAHDLYKNTMAFVGALPWHGLGTKLPENATWGDIKKILPFYRVVEREVFVPEIGKVDAYKAIVRPGANGGGDVLAIVSDGYGVVQFDDIAEAVVEGCGGKAVFHTAGLLGQRGERAFILGEVKMDALKIKGDKSEIRPYFAAVAGHDGRSNVSILNCATRMVCANTVAMALAESGNFVRNIRHTASAPDRVASAGAAFASLVHGYEVLGRLGNLLAATKLDRKQFGETIDAVLPASTEAPTLNKDGRERVSILVDRRETIGALYDSFKGSEGLVGTAWGAVQAWTQFADHHMDGNSPKKISDGSSRLESIWTGRASVMKEASLNAILEVTNLRKEARAVAA